MPRIIRLAESNASSTSTEQMQKIILEIKSPTGRVALEINLAQITSADTDRLSKFFRTNGVSEFDVDDVLKKLSEQASSSGKRFFSAEKLGLHTCNDENAPRIGQAHEIEIPSIRLRVSADETLDHADEFVRSANKFNDLAAIKIVSETLGKTAKSATAEFVLAPASTKDQYEENFRQVKNFRSFVRAQTPHEYVPLSDATVKSFDGPTKKLAIGETAYAPQFMSMGTCVHTSRGVPIRALSQVLQSDDGHLFEEPRMMFAFSKLQTNIFLRTVHIYTRSGKKLWEIINLAIWMAACEGIVQPLLQNKIKEHYPHNRVLNRWLMFAGKGFFGTVPRFSAGDLIRSGGLLTRDIQILEKLFANADCEINKANIALLQEGANKVVAQFIEFLGESQLENLNEISAILKNHDAEIKHWIKRDLKSDFFPAHNFKRYKNDRANSYGDTVNVNKTSPSFAGKQYLPRRELLGFGDKTQNPVTGVIELRRGNNLNNASVTNFFVEEEQHFLDEAWHNFEAYVQRLHRST